MNENEFCDIQRLREIYLSRTKVNPARFGWYIQQFIKMQFARITEDEYYLIWDSDTIPLKPIELFDPTSGKPFMRWNYVDWRAYNWYYKTHSRILPEVKIIAPNSSFILEQMIIKSEYMREMMSEIESGAEAIGDGFQERIMNAVNPGHFIWGFSEFQEYGIYISFRHPGDYVLDGKWRSLRTQLRFWDKAKSISTEERIWLALKYNAISLEKWQHPTKLSGLVKSRLFRAIFPPSILEYIDRPTKAARMIIPRKCRYYIKRLLGIKMRTYP